MPTNHDFLDYLEKLQVDAWEKVLRKDDEVDAATLERESARDEHSDITDIIRRYHEAHPSSGEKKDVTQQDIDSALATVMSQVEDDWRSITQIASLITLDLGVAGVPMGFYERVETTLNSWVGQYTHYEKDIQPEPGGSSGAQVTLYRRLSVSEYQKKVQPVLRDQS